ncbi:hypothetical protein N0V83_007857 [Neocucurbitaria cava]|uniref:Uncharacterized protein n=1 Tax=Neocucurbitaria cava TaxID=798079 RepID=A0A9W8Y3Y7_9PLEO|nr:hypothetical protein N0V83_007857 [Neocucurbitaria cava]
MSSQRQDTPEQDGNQLPACSPATQELAIVLYCPTYARKSLMLSRARRTTPAFRFLDLPPEIRNMIYEQFVVVGKVFYTPEEYDIENGLRCRDHQSFQKPELQLLRVCKQIHDEAESLYLSKNLFVLPIHWYKCYPIDGPKFLTRRTFPRNRPLFSSAGLTYIRFVSVAIDQKMAQPRPFGHSVWKRNEQNGNAFSNFTDLERLELVHDEINADAEEECYDMHRSLSSFRAGLYVQIDCTNAYCALGDCRLIGSQFSIFVGAEFRDYKVIDIIGLESEEEKVKVPYYIGGQGIWARKLRGPKHHIDVRSSKPEDNKMWNKWMIEGILSSEHSLCLEMVRPLVHFDKHLLTEWQIRDPEVEVQFEPDDDSAEE